MSEPIKQKVEIDLEIDSNVTDTSKNPFHVLIHLAKVLDEWRIFPRLFISAYIYVFYEYSMWMMTLAEPTTQQASIYSVITGIGAAWFGLYVNSGPSRRN